ncbi:MAG: hybrid sensor histidine kinase/response regulator [Cyanobacteria bacterium P01_F01_bin.150]
MAKILIIENEDTTRTSLKQILELNDFDVLIASNGIEGIKLAKRALPDLILCDVMMPVLNGHQVLKMLKKRSATATIPFIFLTAKSYQSNIREGMNLGADDYLIKPIKITDLLTCIQTKLQKKELQRQKSEVKLKTLRTNLSRSMPHELNTPLNGIIGLAKILTENSDPEVQELSQGIVESGERLHLTISKILIYTELELAKCSPEESSLIKSARTISTAPLIEVIAEQIAEKAHRKPDLQLKLQPGDISMSSFFFKRLLEELIDNAFKFSENGDAVIIRNHWDHDQMILTVQDHGRGMKPEQIAEVAAYMQFERKIYEQQGMGLGLVIAKYIAELQGGSFKISSQPEVGTAVQIELPLI